MCLSLLNKVILIIDINNKLFTEMEVASGGPRPRSVGVNFPPLATDTEVNNIVLVYTKTVR